MEIPEWHKDAVCATIDVEPWFPDRLNEGAYAKSICKTCPVKVDCFNAAVANDEEYGIWGGVDFTVRRTRRREEDDYGYSGEGARPVTVRASESKRLAAQSRG